MALSYPLELEQNPDFYRSMVELTCYKTDPIPLVKAASAESLPKTASGGVDIGALGGNLFDFLNKFSKGELDIPTGQDGQPIVANEKINRVPGVESIKLYMPVGFSQTDTFSYDVSGIGTMGALGLGVAQAGGGLGAAVGAAMTEGTAALSDIAQSVLGSGAVGPMAIARMGQLAGGQTGTAIELAGQSVANPNIRAAFKAYPKDLPEGSDVSLAYEYPYLWRVVPKVKTSAGYDVAVGTPIKFCFIESISVVNNPIGNNTFHEDGMPVQFDLSINFVEYRTLSRKEFTGGKEVPGSQIAGDADPPGIKVELEPARTLSPIEEISNQGSRVFNQVGRFRGGL